jgi:HAMP domain-containing protein
MSESDILQNLFDAITAILTVFSLFFAIVSGYVAALFFFLGRAPVALRAMAFVLMSIGLVFLGGTATVIGRMQEGLFAAWDRLERPIVPLQDLRNPVPGMQLAGGISQQELGVAIGWGVAVAVYLALFYLTFVYRWPSGAPAER